MKKYTLFIIILLAFGLLYYLHTQGVFKRAQAVVTHQKNQNPKTNE
ncbi:MAG: hypothetical protein WBA17_15240 [Saprospiraceae bacterium]